MVNNRSISRLFIIALTAVACFGCTRDEIVPYVPENIRIEIVMDGSLNGLPDFEGYVTLPYERAFDSVKADVTGFDWQVIATIEGNVQENGQLIFGLLNDFSDEQLCKVARDTYNDYEGFWPAAEVSDRSAKVAGLGDIIAYKNGEPVGRLVLTDWDGSLETAVGSYFIYFHYTDRPFALSGYSLTKPGNRASSIYEASFETGWNVYANINKGNNPMVCTTDLPDDLALRWRFEPWP